MNIARWSVLVVLIGLGVVRALGYFVYAAASLQSPLETFHLESKMVLLAYRVELGESLYPAWREYPHVANFFGPVYFEGVGLVGRAVGADIPGLFRVGRWVSFGSGVFTSLIIGVIVARRFGSGCGVTGGIVSIGAAPVFGFSVMVRPDLSAEFLGVLGFFLAIDKASLLRTLGVVVLIVAALTKQTTAIFMLAAVVGWALEGFWWRGLLLGLSASIVLATMVGAVTLWLEPNFAKSLVGESKTPWELASLIRTLKRACALSPDILYFPALGLGLWVSGATGRREWRLAVLAALLLATSVGLSAKKGADLNYYLGLRAVEALAVGALWQAWTISMGRRRSIALAIAAIVGCLTMLPGVNYALNEAQVEQGKARFLEGPESLELRGFYRSICSMAADRNFRLLTDSGLFDLYQGNRAAFGDPWLFRILSETGQVDLSLIRSRIESQYYDLIVTTSEINLPSYDSYEFGLPRILAKQAAARYVRVDYRDGLFLYERKPGPVPMP